ncbi:unnamed protein product [Musa textilis]
MAESADEGGSRDTALGADGDPRRSRKASTNKGKSCKGCLYYSSRLKSDARIPVCVGISRTLPQGIEVISCFYKLLKSILADVVFLFRTISGQKSINCWSCSCKCS